MKIRTLVPALALLSACPFGSEAALIDRGNGMAYDDALDITWLTDANYAKTSGHDADGLMDWTSANAWAEGLTYEGFSDWRLPNMDVGGDGKVFYCNPNLTPSTEAECRDNELGYMYYYNLGGTIPKTPKNGDQVVGDVTLTGINSYNWSLTDNLHTSYNDPATAWAVHVGRGSGHANLTTQKTTHFGAWAVRSGDVLPTVVVYQATWKPGKGKLVVSGALQFTPAFTVVKRRELRQMHRITIIDAANNLPIKLDVSVKRDGTWRTAFRVNDAAVACSVKADFAGKQSAVVPVTNAPSYCAP